MSLLRLPPSVYYVFVAFLISGLVTLTPVPLGLSNGEINVATTFTIVGILYMVIGILWRRISASARPMLLGDAILSAILSWILVPLFSAIPLTLALNIPFIDAWFESVSGFTTTGLTIFTGEVDPDYHVYLPRVDEIPVMIQFWRSFLQWIGGIGILVLFAAFAVGRGIPSHLIGMAEGRYEHLEPSIARSMRAFIEVYAVLTVVAVLLFLIAGMPLYDAINHAMTGIATGGFSVRPESIAYYGSVLIELAAITIMLLGALNFSDHYAWLRGESLRIVRNPETHILIVIIALLSYSATTILVSKGWPLPEALRLSLFQFISAVTGTGFQTMDIASAPDAYKLMLTAACLLGGSILSTTGGIKMFRLLIVLSSLKWIYYEVSTGPGRVVVRKLAGRNIDMSTMQQAVAIISLFIVTWLSATILLLIIMPYRDITDIGFEAASALGNVGLSTGVATGGAPLAAKLVFIALMSLGRLEILPYLMAIGVAAYQAKLWLARRRRQRLAAKLVAQTMP